MRFLTDIQDLPLVFHRSSRNRKKDLIHMVLLHHCQNRISSANDRNPIHQSSPFIIIVINDTDRTRIHLSRILQITHNNLTRSSRSDHHCPVKRILLFIPPGSFHIYKAVGKSNRSHKRELHNSPYNIVGNRHSFHKNRNSKKVKNSRYGR